MKNAKKIDSVLISALTRSVLDPLPVVRVRLEGETDYRVLFSFYSDEISFNETEILGLTLAQAQKLKRKKDSEYWTG